VKIKCTLYKWKNGVNFIGLLLPPMSGFLFGARGGFGVGLREMKDGNKEVLPLLAI